MARPTFSPPSQGVQHRQGFVTFDPKVRGNFRPSPPPPPAILADPTHFVSSGSFLLDCILGGGWAQNRIANIVGDKCLSGDTIVSAQRGDKPRKMTMQTLFNRVKGNHSNRNGFNETYMVADIGGYVGMNKLLDIVMSGEKMLYEITNDRGQTIKASADHKFSAPDMPDEWGCLSDNLTIGSVVKCWRGTRDVIQHERNRKPRAYTYSIPFHPFGQRNIVGSRDYKRLPTARLLLEAEINGLALQEFISILRKDAAKAATLYYTDPAFDVHHLDDDCTNDAIDNLQLVEPGDHWKIHADEMPQNTKAIDISEIVSIKRVGIETTFDITMEAPYHNFIANGFVVHNSTGKTLLAIEACANFALVSPLTNIRYIEAEAAFDEAHGLIMGMPPGIKVADDIRTIEEFFDDVVAFLTAQQKNSYPSLYVLDSLDALSDTAEMEKKEDEGSYGTAKAKKLSEFFRKRARDFELAKCTLMVISQLRDKLNVRFGETKTRSGGNALNFYASQIVWLVELGKIKRQYLGVDRITGIHVLLRNRKNKVGRPYRDVEQTLLFEYGFDDEISMIQWLSKSKAFTPAQAKEWSDAVAKARVSQDRETHLQLNNQLRDIVWERWQRIEAELAPPMRKYS
jgi:RecA/RadA recombinase